MVAGYFPRKPQEQLLPCSPLPLPPARPLLVAPLVRCALACWPLGQDGPEVTVPLPRGSCATGALQCHRNSHALPASHRVTLRQGHDAPQPCLREVPGQRSEQQAFSSPSRAPPSLSHFLGKVTDTQAPTGPVLLKPSCLTRPSAVAWCQPGPAPWRPCMRHRHSPWHRLLLTTAAVSPAVSLGLGQEGRRGHTPVTSRPEWLHTRPASMS